MVEFGGQTLSEAESQALRLIDALNRSATPPKVQLYSGAQAKRIWEIRESSLGATSHVPGEPLNWEGWEDAGGRARKTRRLSPRPAQDDGRLRLQRLALRPLRPRLRAHAPQLRSAIERGHRQIPQVRRGSRRSRRQLWRLALRRTRRRPGPRRTAAENVRPGTDAGLPQIQVRLGSRLEDESGQTHRFAREHALQARRESSPRPGLRAVGARDALPVSRRSRQPRRTPPCAASASANAAAKKAA